VRRGREFSTPDHAVWGEGISGHDAGDGAALIVLKSADFDRLRMEGMMMNLCAWRRNNGSSMVKALLMDGSRQTADNSSVGKE
jgi:hypothetical protein